MVGWTSRGTFHFLLLSRGSAFLRSIPLFTLARMVLVRFARSRSWWLELKGIPRKDLRSWVLFLVFVLSIGLSRFHVPFTQRFLSRDDFFSLWLFQTAWLHAMFLRGNMENQTTADVAPENHAHLVRTTITSTSERWLSRCQKTSATKSRTESC